eukprot:comp20462_c0_seq1/m.26050 comp20462_c0_seq1/g.26050  ORF comp20462_c0_seq1/g.26050 comp20462_c0_seq1/m.26050 type:complete len:415 (-) comp20462_c0_seq1:511-1755(-)
MRDVFSMGRLSMRKNKKEPSIIDAAVDSDAAAIKSSYGSVPKDTLVNKRKVKKEEAVHTPRGSTSSVSSAKPKMFRKNMHMYSKSPQNVIVVRQDKIPSDDERDEVEGFREEKKDTFDFGDELGVDAEFVRSLSRSFSALKPWEQKPDTATENKSEHNVPVADLINFDEAPPVSKENLFSRTINEAQEHDSFYMIAPAPSRDVPSRRRRNLQQRSSWGPSESADPFTPVNGSTQSTPTINRVASGSNALARSMSDRSASRAFVSQSPSPSPMNGWDGGDVFVPQRSASISIPPVSNFAQFPDTNPFAAAAAAVAQTSSGVRTAPKPAPRPLPVPPARRISAPPVVPPRPLSCERITVAEATYDFMGFKPTDLQFKKGDHIVVTKQRLEAASWWEGKVGDRTGEFPGNYVRILFA